MSAERPLKSDALRILQAALSAADAGNAVRQHFRMPSGEFNRVLVISVGKAAYAMATAVTETAKQSIGRVIVVTKHGHAGPSRAGWEIHEAGHPIPDENGLRAAYAVRDAVRGLDESDLVIVAVSGGASALLSAPAEPVTLEDKQQTTDLLLRAGADIYELNTIRKQLSFLKGGRLAALAYPARVIGLLLSDVIGDPMDVIGSGPTVPDTSTPGDAEAILRKRGLWDRVPPTVRERLSARESARHSERVENVIVGSNRLALEAAAKKADQLGYPSRIVSDCLQGEAREVAREQACLFVRADTPACLLSGGETTVTVKGKGKGGRNQEFALALACQIEGAEDRAVLCAGTDGTDGPTDAAGAYADGGTVRRALGLGMQPLEHLDNNDAYPFFERLGDLIKTGPTGTNVMDINIMLARKS